MHALYKVKIIVNNFLQSHLRSTATSNAFYLPCGRLSWLHVSFLLHVKYTLSYRIV